MFRKSSDDIKVTLKNHEVDFIKKDKLGDGAFGTVYNAELNIPATHSDYEYLSKKKWVIKQLYKKNFNALEVKNSAKFKATSQPKNKDHLITWATEFILGQV